MGAATRYRYKGRFVSRQDAARISNLVKASKHLKTEIILDKKLTGSYKGYRRPVAEAVRAALAADRVKARARRIVERAPEVSRQKAVAADWRQRRFDKERVRAGTLARHAAIYASEEGIDIEDALDAVGFDPDKFQFFDFEEVSGMARRYLSEGEGFFDFEMADLEDEDPYGSLYP